MWQNIPVFWLFVSSCLDFRFPPWALLPLLFIINHWSVSALSSPLFFTILLAAVVTNARCDKDRCVYTGVFVMVMVMTMTRSMARAIKRKIIFVSLFSAATRSKLSPKVWIRAVRSNSGGENELFYSNETSSSSSLQLARSFRGPTCSFLVLRAGKHAHAHILQSL